MKKLTCILWVLALSSSAFAGISRSEEAGKFNLSYENTSLATVLNDISTFSSQNFVFRKANLQNVLVNINERNASLKESLNSILEENGFEFENLGMDILAIRPMPDAPVVEVAAVVSVVEQAELLTEALPAEEPTIFDKLIERLEDPEMAMSVAQFQRRYVSWLQEQGFSTSQAIELVRSASGAELLIQAQM